MCGAGPSGSASESAASGSSAAAGAAARSGCCSVAAITSTASAPARPGLVGLHCRKPYMGGASTLGTACAMLSHMQISLAQVSGGTHVASCSDAFGRPFLQEHCRHSIARGLGGLDCLRVSCWCSERFVCVL